MAPKVLTNPDLDEDAETAADAQGLADLEAGRAVSGDAVKRWLRSWGTPDRSPTPKVGD
jgi:predicted transcriptional regulator